MRVWFGLLALVVATGFALQFYLLFTGGADANSGETGEGIPIGVRFVRLFSFFTVLSNVVVLVVAVLLALGRRLSGTVERVTYLSALLSILVTGTVFGLILAPGIQLRELAVVATNLFHLVSPAMFVLGWAVWGPRRLWNVRLALLAFAWPIAWIVYTFAAGAVTGWYPYPFLDAGRLGVGPALLGAAAVVVYAAVLAVVVLLVDRKAPAAGQPVSPPSPARPDR